MEAELNDKEVLHPMTFQTKSKPVLSSSLTAAAKYLVPGLPLFGCDGCHMMIWVTRGSMSVVANGERHTVNPHSAVLIAADATKTVEVSTGAFGTVVSLPALPEFALPAPVMIAKVPNIGDQQRLSAMLEQLLAEVNASDDLAQDAARHMAHYLFIHLIRMANTSVKKTSSSQQLMADFCKLLEQQFRSGRGLSDYAKQLNVSTAHLSRVSRTLNGKSANRLIQDRIFLQARYELATGTGKVQQIGATLGFASPAYFTRLFADKIGLPPREYRSQHRQRTSKSSYSMSPAE